jgi:hypothetical protein
VSEEQNAQQLLREGIELAREGKKAEARAVLEKVVELDDKNEKGWFWLASVVETDEEKRVCLGNVLFINPNNERAQKAMAQLQQKENKRKGDEEVMPGISRRQLMIFGGGGMAVIIVILLIFLVITGSRNAQVAEETRVAQAAINATTQVFQESIASATSAHETQVALASPTPTLTLTPNRPTEVPTWTPTPTATLPVTAAPLAAPSGVGGNILAWSGRNLSNPEFLPIGMFSVSSGQFTLITSNPSRDASFKGDFQKIIYTRFFPTTSDFGMEEIGVNGTGAAILGQGLAIIKQQMPHYCPTANRFTFVALPTDTREIQFGAGETVNLPFQVFVFDFDTATLSRITNDEATYSYPRYSPDCTRIAVVRDNVGGGSPGADIVNIDTATLTQTPLTADLGGFKEASPRWSPDGTQIVYSARSVNEPGNGDVVLRAADGSGSPLLPIPDETNADDIFPVFSPDGRYIAFSSNRGGFYDIYVYDQVDSTLYQLTNGEDQDYPGDWSP